MRSSRRRPSLLTVAGLVAVPALVAGLLLARPPDTSPAGHRDLAGASRQGLTGVPSDPGDPSDPVALARAFPLTFEANVGQADPAARYLARGRDYRVFLTGRDPVVALGGSAVQLQFLGGAGSPAVEPGPRLTARSHYLVGHPSQWHTDVPSYQSVAYRQVYPGVDVVYYGTDQQLEHDFVVSPGADPGVIALALDGADRPRLETGGDVVAAVTGEAGENVRLRRPVAYQDAGGRRVGVAAEFDVRPDGTIGLRLGAYDRLRPLVIDPVLQTSTYLGGGGREAAYSVDFDNAGNILVAGLTESSNFPVTGGPQAALAQEATVRSDAFVAKFGPDGTTLVSATYLGGRGTDLAFGVAAGPDGAAYVAGQTESPDFPVANPLQPAFAGGPTDAFVAKLSPSGTEVQYATFLGGKNSDLARAIDVAADGSAVVVGSTRSDDFPTTAPVQAALSGPNDVDAFVARLDPSGSALAASTYLGAVGDDQALGVTLDSSGAVYVVGDTRSPTFPIVAGAQTVFGSGESDASDAFITKLDPAVTSIVYSTYLGGDASDQGAAIAVGSDGSAYVTGNTGSTNFPTVRPLQARKDGDFDAFVAKLDPSGSSVTYSTHLGGTGTDGGSDITVDGQGRAAVVGSTASLNFPVARPFQPAKGGGFIDAFVSVLEPSGGALAMSSYMGGRDEDNGAAVAVDAAGTLHVVGYTNSSDFPTAKPFQPEKGGGGGDAFVARVTDQAAPAGEGASPGSDARENRIRILTAVTMGLFLIAVLHTLWIRRRMAQEPTGPGPGPGPGPAPIPAAPPTPMAGDDWMERRPVPAGTAKPGVTVLPPDQRLTSVPPSAVGGDPIEEVAVPDLLSQGVPDDKWADAVLADDLWAPPPTGSRAAPGSSPPPASPAAPSPGPVISAGTNQPSSEEAAAADALARLTGKASAPSTAAASSGLGEPSGPAGAGGPQSAGVGATATTPGAHGGPGRAEPAGEVDVPDLWTVEASGAGGAAGAASGAAAAGGAGGAEAGTGAGGGGGAGGATGPSLLGAGSGPPPEPSRLSLADLLAEDLAIPTPLPRPEPSRATIADLLDENLVIPDRPAEGTLQRNLADDLARQLAEAMEGATPPPAVEPTAPAVSGHPADQPPASPPARADQAPVVRAPTVSAPSVGEPPVVGTTSTLPAPASSHEVVDPSPAESREPRRGRSRGRPRPPKPQGGGQSGQTGGASSSGGAGSTPGSAPEQPGASPGQSGAGSGPGDGGSGDAGSGDGGSGDGGVSRSRVYSGRRRRPRRR